MAGAGLVAVRTQSLALSGHGEGQEDQREKEGVHGLVYWQLMALP